MKNYLRILARTTNTVLFISESKMSVITENVLLPIAMGMAPSQFFDAGNVPLLRAETVQTAKQSSKVGANDIAIINVFDTLAAKGSAGLSGGTTYESIRTDIERAVSAGYSSIMLYIDSPGGEATGLFALTDYIRSLQAQGIFVFSYVDGMATSAAYAIAASTQAIYATNTSLLGSIGAIMVHLDVSKADATAGRTYTIFRSKPEKALGDSHTPLTETVINKFNTLLDNMDTAFNNDVLQSRPNLTLENIISTKASEFIASDALSLGLADKIVSGVDSAISMALQKRTGSSATKLTSTKPIGMKMDEEQLRVALQAAQAENAQLKLDLATAATVALTNERERVCTILNAATTLKASMTTTVRHIQKGFAADESLEIMTDMAAERGTSTQLNTENNSAEADADLDVKLTKSVEQKPDAEDRKNRLRAGAKAAGLKFKSNANAGV